MATKVETRHTSEFLVSEADGTRSRDAGVITVPANTTLGVGYVLGRLTASPGKYVPYDNVGTDGSEVAYGILYEDVVNGTGAPVDIKATVINMDAEVRSADLVFLGSLIQADKDAAYADLLARGIKVRA